MTACVQIRAQLSQTPLRVDWRDEPISLHVRTKREEGQVSNLPLPNVTYVRCELAADVAERTDLANLYLNRVASHKLTCRT